MSDTDTLKQMIIAGDEKATAQTEKLLGEGATAREILDRALLPGMEVVGERMKNDDLFIPEVLLSAATMQACLDLVKPHLGAGENTTAGTVVIGTVEGDMHDIGKNLVVMLLSGAGFDVIDLGKGVTPSDFVAAVQEHKPDVLGMSGLLTTTIRKMPETISALKAAGLRDQVKVIVGGAPVSNAFAQEIGSDAYGPDASVGVQRCKELVADTSAARR